VQKVDDLSDTYKKETESCIKTIHTLLKTLQKKPSDPKAISELVRAAHTLKGASLQMGYYSVAYIARMMEDFSKNLQIRKKVNMQDLAFLEDFTSSIDKSIGAETAGETSKIEPELLKKIDRLEIKEKEELKRLFSREFNENLGMIDKGLQALEKNPDDKEAVLGIRKATHSLEGDSLLAEEYQVAYLSQKINLMVKEGEIKYIRHFYETLKQSLGQTGESLEKKHPLQKLKSLHQELQSAEDRRKQAEDSLKESEQRFRLAFEYSRDAVFLVEPQSRMIIDCNESARKLLDKKKKEIIGQPETIIYPSNKAQLFAMALKRRLDKEGYVDDETIVITKKGKQRDVRITASAILVSGKAMIQLIFQDITEKKKMEVKRIETNAMIAAEKARSEESEAGKKKIEAYFDSMNEGVVVLDSNGLHTEVNQAFMDMLKLDSEKDIIGKPFYRYISKTYIPQNMNAMIKARKNKEKYIKNADSVLIAKNKKEVPVLVNVTLLWDEAGQYDGAIAVLRDISNIKEKEKQVKQLKERIEFILGSTKTNLDIIDPNFNLVYVDPKWEKRYGDPKGKKCYEYFAGRKKACLTCGIPKALKTKKPVVTEIVLPKEGNRPIQVTTVPFKDEGGKWMVAEVKVDITERKKAEEEIKESEEKFRLIFESSRDGMAMANLKGILIDANKAFCDMHGYKRKELVDKKTFMELTPEKWNKIEGNIIKNQVMKRGYSDSFDKEQIKKNGEIFPVNVTIHLIKDKHGKPFRMWAIVKDITEKKRAEEEIKAALKETEEERKKTKESEEKLKTVLYSMQEGVIITDANHNITSVNQAVPSILGYNEKDLIGKSVATLYASKKDRQRALNELERRGNISNLEVKIKKKNGGKIDVLANVSLIKDAKGNVVQTVGSFLDISERKRYQERLEDHAAEMQEKTSELELANLKLRASEQKMWLNQKMLKGNVKDLQNLHEELRKSEGRWERTFDSISDFVFIQDKEFRFIRVNKAFADALKVKPEDLIGKKCYNVLHKSKKPWPGCPTLKSLKDKKPHTAEIDDPKIGVPLLVSASPMFDEKGNVTGMVHIAKNISEEKKAKEILKRGKQELEQAVKERTKELEIAAKELVEEEAKLTKANEELKEREGRYKELFDLNHDGVVFVDIKGNIKNANKAYQNMVGYNLDELRNLTYQQLTPKKWHKMEAEIVKNQMMKRGYSDWYEKEYIKKDGTIFPIKIFGRLIKDKQGKPTRLWGIARDVSKEKKAEEELKKSEEKYGLVIDSADVATWDWDLITDITHWGNGLTKLFGYKDLNVKNSKQWWVSKIDPSYMEKVGKTITNHIKKKITVPWKEEYYFKKADGSLAYVIDWGKLMLDKKGKPVRMIGAMLDITKQKKTEEKLKMANEELKAANRSMLDDDIKLEKAYKDLRRVDELKSEAIRNVSHEFRTDISAIDNSAKKLKEQCHSSKPDKKVVSESFDMLFTYSGKFQEQINAILQLGMLQRIESIEKEKTDMNSVITGVIGEYSSKAKEKDLSVKKNIGKLPKISTNPELIKTMIRNLVKNAIKFTDKGYIKVSGKKQGKDIVISVEDTGEGISKEDMDKLFQPYTRLNPLKEGVGVGLAIVKRAVELHNGEIDVESKLDKGTKFVVKIPIK